MKHEAEGLLLKVPWRWILIYYSCKKLQETLWFTYCEKHKINSLGENFQPSQYVQISMCENCPDGRGKVTDIAQ